MQLAQDNRVIALVQRGHDGSLWTESYSFEALHGDLLESTEHLGLGQFLPLRPLAGRHIAAIFADQYVERLTGLVLVDSPPPDGEGDWTVPQPAPRRLLPSASTDP